MLLLQICGLGSAALAGTSAAATTPSMHSLTSINEPVVLVRRGDGEERLRLQRRREAEAPNQIGSAIGADPAPAAPIDENEARERAEDLRRLEMARDNDLARHHEIVARVQHLNSLVIPEDRVDEQRYHDQERRTRQLWALRHQQVTQRGRLALPYHIQNHLDLTDHGGDVPRLPPHMVLIAQQQLDHHLAEQRDHHARLLRYRDRHPAPAPDQHPDQRAIYAAYRDVHQVQLDHIAEDLRQQQSVHERKLPIVLPPRDD